VVSHAVPMVGYLKGAPLRSPLDLSFAFASEQTIDELAFMAKIDPLEFRRNNIGDARWLGVLNAAAGSRWARITCLMALRSPISRSIGAPATSSPPTFTPRSTRGR